MKKAKVIACVPTYCEPQKVTEILNSCAYIKYRPFELVIVNANPEDETSEIIANRRKLIDYELVEVEGNKDEFWSGTVNRGLRKILDTAGPKDWVLLMNVDIKFDTDIVDLLTQKALKEGKCQISALSTSNSYVISSGVQVKSWMATLTTHPYTGTKVSDLPNDLLIRANYLPTRCLLFPSEALTEVGLVAEKCLPHYGADYEFTRRLAKKGYTPYISTAVHIEADTENTGKSVYSSETNFVDRLSNLINIKNPSNPKFRVIFVLLVYPLYAIPTAIVAYLLRTFIEVFFNKNQIYRFLGQKERGFSG
jgi:GT2 family glycosyltransferase